jgi:hypothetical protein
LILSKTNQGVAQSGRVPALDAGCRRFESCRPDHLRRSTLVALGTIWLASIAGPIAALHALPARDSFAARWGESQPTVGQLLWLDERTSVPERVTHYAGRATLVGRCAPLVASRTLCIWDEASI